MDKLWQFLQSSTGELSSKRLVFFIASIVFIAGTVGFTAFLIHKKEFQTATTMWSYLSYFSMITGGFVTSEILPFLFKKK